jgi:hypothetical protein
MLEEHTSFAGPAKVRATGCRVIRVIRVIRGSLLVGALQPVDELLVHLVDRVDRTRCGTIALKLPDAAFLKGGI